MLKFGAVLVGAGEAQSCVRCYPKAEQVYDPVEVVTERARGIVTEWRDGPGPNVTLLGPEPLGHPEVARVVESVMALGVERLCVVTSGEPLVNPGMVNGLIASGVTHVRVTVLAGDPAINDDLVGRTGSLEGSLEGARLFAETARMRDVPYILCGRVPVCRHNIEQLPGAVLALVQIGVRSIALDLTKTPTGPSTGAWIDAAVDTGIVSGAWVCTSGSAQPDGLRTRPPVEILNREAIA